MKIEFDKTSVDWAKVGGLIPVVVQDRRSLRVLMLGYMNDEALTLTLQTGLVTFFSRTKQRIWQKGETSGHVLRVSAITLDCDQDTILALVDPEGPTCHLGTRTCFGDKEEAALSTLADLAAVIHSRRVSADTQSYTAKLFSEGIVRVAQKVGEEGVETALAAATKAPNLADEAADLVYHLLVLLEACDVSLWTVLEILAKRAHAKK